MDDRTIGQRIAAERKNLGLSQEQLGEKTGVSRQAISKWESDAAIPEIDKLIGLSRLFEVSIGWLLGVEDGQEKQSDQLTEPQLKALEEIVRQYQPKPTGHRLTVALTAIIAIAAVCITSFFQKPEPTDYSGQIDAIHQENLSIQSQLDTINGRLEAISAGLANYSFELVGVSAEYADLFIPTEPTVSPGTATVQTDTDVDIDFALLSFGAVPQSRDETESVFLGVFYHDRIISKIPLDWINGVYHAVFSLPLADGYEYCFIRVQNDAEQWYDLRQTGYSNLTEIVSSTPAA